MGAQRRHSWIVQLAALLTLLISCFSVVPQANAYDNPELLPDRMTPVIDLARAFSNSQRDSLESTLNAFEERTGWNQGGAARAPDPSQHDAASMTDWT